jgi:hypothetical protein
MLVNFKHPETADLYHLLSSPELLGNGTLSYTEQLAQDVLPEILEWDSNSYLNKEKLNQGKIRRLGFYAEELLRFLLENHPRFKVHVCNHQIIENKRTVGELDFVFEDLRLNKLIHLELACKFYVRTGTQNELNDFVGIGGNDNLGKKAEKMSEKQLQPNSQWFGDIPTLEGRIPETIGSVKGRLFYPDQFEEVNGLNPNHAKGTILKSLEDLDDSFHYCHKLAWISGSDGPREGWPASIYDAQMFFSETRGKWCIYKKEGFGRTM